MRTPRLSDERGIALAVAVFALVVIGALVAGIFFAGRLEQKSGQSTVYLAQASEAAEAGLTEPTTQDFAYASVPLGSVATLTTVSLGGNVFTTPSVTRLNNELFLVRSVGERRDAAGNVLASRAVGSLVRLRIATFNAPAALTARGTVRVAGTADIIGNNSDPENWTGCPTIDTSLAGIATSGDVNTNGSPTILGSPAMIENSTDIVDSTFNNPFDALAAVRDFTIPGAGLVTLSPNPTLNVSPVTCKKRNTDGTINTLNWGEPRAAPASGVVTECQNYFPIILRSGNLKLNNGRGQGVLLVDGDLDVAGNFEFVGVVIVRGTFSASHGTNSIYGAVMSSNANLDQVTIGGTPTVRYSACGVSRALTANASAVPLAQRSWLQLYN
jgi:hypothetical protein